ncbi:MAG: hypothetical protein ABL928_16765 [Sphingorhabdus sp.]
MRDQTEANYRWFKSRLADLMVSHRGFHALLHNQSVDDYFRTSLDAVKAGLSKHGEGNFSVELVDDTFEDLGFYSHVSSALRA